MPRPTAALAATAALIAALVVAPGSGAVAAPAVQQFANCADLHRVHPAGVAKKGVTVNRVGSKTRRLKGPVTFSTPLYQANRARDRDGDGIACELS